MQPIDAYLITVIASALIPALYLIFAANGRLWRAVALWLAWPLLVYFVLFLIDTAAAPAGTYSLSDALLGLSLLSAFLILPWLAISAVVIGLALVIRKLVHRSDATPQNSAPDLAPTAKAASAAAANAALAGPAQLGAPVKVDWRALVTLIVGSVVVIAVIASVAVYLGDTSPKPEPIIAVPEGGFRPK